MKKTALTCALLQFAFLPIGVDAATWCYGLPQTKSPLVFTSQADFQAEYNLLCAGNPNCTLVAEDVLGSLCYKRYPPGSNPSAPLPQPGSVDPNYGTVFDNDQAPRETYVEKYDNNGNLLGYEYNCIACGSVQFPQDDVIVIGHGPEPNNCRSKGLTWSRNDEAAVSSAIRVGNDTNVSNPYQGDTVCEIKQSLLCINTSNSFAKPFDVITRPPTDPRAAFDRWSGGVVALTDEVAGCEFKTLSEADAYCVDKFGADWRTASFHDGGGWSFWAYGNILSAETRFWVNIADQPATCWAQN